VDGKERRAHKLLFRGDLEEAERFFERGGGGWQEEVGSDNLKLSKRKEKGEALGRAAISDRLAIFLPAQRTLSRPIKV